VAILAGLALLGGCFTTTSSTRLVSDIRIYGDSLSVTRCNMVYEAEHREAAVIVLLPVAIFVLAFAAAGAGGSALSGGGGGGAKDTAHSRGGIVGYQLAMESCGAQRSSLPIVGGAR